MRRREFLGVLGGAAAWPLAASAQEKLPVIGFLNSTSPAAFANNLRAVQQGLNETGYVDGRNAAIEYRWAEDRYDRLPAPAAATSSPVTAALTLVVFSSSCSRSCRARHASHAQA
jgi:putative ABC transport system substrate-binding protein